MKTTKLRNLFFVILVTISLIISGCGGGDDNDDPVELNATTETCLNTPSQDTCSQE